LLQPRQRIIQLPTIVHGGIHYAEIEKLTIQPQNIIDFSVSHNPYGPPAEVLAVLNSVCISDYPDPEAKELRRHLSERLKVKPENLLAGSGATELVRLAAMAYFDPGDRVLIPQPTYGEYEIAARIMGAQPIKEPVLEEATHFSLDIKNLLRSIERYRPKGVFLCNPNNPTGQCVTREDIAKAVAAASDCLFIIDEAYIALVDNAEIFSSLELIHHGNVLILRSMTKDFALAGLRLGYVVAAPQIIEALRKVCPPWNVNALAQSAGIAALRAEGYIEECREKIRLAKEFLLRRLSNIGLTAIPSQANFFLVKVGSAKNFHRALLQKGFLVRDCSSFELPEYVRISPRTIPECDKLITAVKEVLKDRNWT